MNKKTLFIAGAIAVGLWYFLRNKKAQDAAAANDQMVYAGGTPGFYDNRSAAPVNLVSLPPAPVPAVMPPGPVPAFVPAILTPQQEFDLQSQQLAASLTSDNVFTKIPPPPGGWLVGVTYTILGNQYVYLG